VEDHSFYCAFGLTTSCQAILNSNPKKLNRRGTNKKSGNIALWSYCVGTKLIKVTVLKKASV